MVEPGHRVVHVPAGPFDLPKEELVEALDEFTAGVREHLLDGPGANVIHGNYWLSGMVGHRLKHDLDLPLVSTFHTLARVKAEGGDLEPSWRDRAESEIIGCSDAICVSCPEEERQFRRLYGNPGGVVEIVPPAVEHAFFAPGDRARRTAAPCTARRPSGRALRRTDPTAQGAGRCRAGDRPACTATTRCSSSSAAPAASMARPRSSARSSWSFDLGSTDRVRFVRPQPHHILSSYYRAADVVLVPSRSESFGLVALEAAACGIPVVASAVGGLLNIVHDGVTGLLVEGRDPARFARAIDQVLDDPSAAAAMGAAAAVRGPPIHVGLHGGPAAAAVHRPCGAAGRALVACS